MFRMDYKLSGNTGIHSRYMNIIHEYTVGI